MSTIAIIGATGMLGGDVARRLVTAGHSVVAITRDGNRASALAGLGAEVRIADLTDRASLTGAVRGADAVFAAAHSLLGRGRYRSDHVDRDGHIALIDVAKSERIPHFVYSSVMGTHAAHPVPFWRRKAAVEAHLRASGMAHTILRPSAFMELHAHELLGKAILSGKPAVILGGGNRPMNFVAVRDVASVAVNALTGGIPPGETIEIGGPDNRTRNQVAETYARLAGLPHRARHIPLGAVRILASVLRPIHPGISGVMQASVELESIDETFDPTDFLRRFPMTLTPLDDFIRERVAAARR